MNSVRRRDGFLWTSRPRAWACPSRNSAAGPAFPNPVRIAGRCSVFAESDMIHKQQLGNSIEDIIAGLCDALVRNYLNNLAKGKDIRPPVVFQGGVAANAGIKRAFEKALGLEVPVPREHGVTGALGAALLARAAVKDRPTAFVGLAVSEMDHAGRSFYCTDCANNCEIVEVTCDNAVVPAGAIAAANGRQRRRPVNAGCYSARLFSFMAGIGGFNPEYHP